MDEFGQTSSECREERSVTGRPDVVSEPSAGIKRENIRRIAVFRALRIGDMLCAIPALRALRSAFPKAEISWIGLPELAGLAARYPAFIDRFIPFPGHPDLPERPAPAREFETFVKTWRHRFDMVIQMHGDGRISNGIAKALVPRKGQMLAFSRGGDPAQARAVYVPYPEGLHEVHRLLRLIEVLGVDVADDRLQFPLYARDAQDLANAAPRGFPEGAGYVCIHPGASVGTRRWPIERFCTVARFLQRKGIAIVLTGDRADRRLTRRIQDAIHQRALDLAGRTTLGALALVLRNASAVIVNDTSVSHLASAVGAASVTIITASDPLRWAPLDKDLNRSVWVEGIRCRPCTHKHCPWGHECAAGITVRRVLAILTGDLWRRHVAA
ncbi:MAG: glycosyltransferase family 9 protein [Acidiferrobacteraceae bacterium]